jgi:hypothetical protein
MSQGAEQPRGARLGEPDAGSAPGTSVSASVIVSAAERLADEIRRNAEIEADAIRARAGSDSDSARAATADRVRRLSALADGMLERLGEMRAELDALSASLAPGVPEAVADGAPDPAELGAPELAGAGASDVEAVAAAPEPARGVRPAPEPPGVPVPEPHGVSAVPEPHGVSAVPEPPVVTPALEPLVSAAAPEAPAAGVDDAGARLIALNLALSDTPRDEAARQLRGEVPDPERLVDEVYSSVDR